MAPIPGIIPSRKATPGLPLLGTAAGSPIGWATGTAVARGDPATPVIAGDCGADSPITPAKHSSQYSTSFTGRTQVEHMGLPQLRQNPDASTSGCTAHFIDSSSPGLGYTRLPAFPSAGPPHSPDSVVAAASAYGRRSDRGLSPVWTSASSLPAQAANRSGPAATAIGFRTRRAGR